MFALLLLGAAQAAALPDVSVAWRDGLVRLSVVAPAGEHVAAEAPVSASLRLGAQETSVDAYGAQLLAGLAITYVPGPTTARGDLRLSLCQDKGTACRMVDLAFQGEMAGKKGEARWTGAAPGAAGSSAPAGHAAEKIPVEQVFATAGDRLVLLDFGAVWCPPCNLLNAAVLDDPADAALLSAFAIARIDVDRPESWTMKDRYHVGGYPTLVAARADGTEVDRMLGYTDEARTKAWLASLSTLAAQTLPPPDQASPSQAMAEALRLLRADQAEAAAPWVARVTPTPAELADLPDMHLMRFYADNTAAELPWLVAHGVPWQDWLFNSLPLLKEDASLRAPMAAAARAALNEATLTEAGDLMWFQAQIAEADGVDAKGLYAAGAAMLKAGLSGNPELDRGYYTSLADLYEGAGDTVSAAALLLSAQKTWPDEFTWSYALANLLVDAGRPADALPYAQKAMADGYGDNRLRAVNVVAKTLHTLGRDADALALIDKTLAEAERPAEGLDVRTPRYLKTLETTRGEIAGR